MEREFLNHIDPKFLPKNEIGAQFYKLIYAVYVSKPKPCMGRNGRA